MISVRTLMRELWKRKSFRFLTVTLAILLGVAVVILLITTVGYHTEWTGFNQRIDNVPSGHQEQPAKTLWDWLQLLIIPVVLALGAFLLNFATNRTERKIAAQRYKNDQEIAAQRYESDQKIAAQRYESDQKIALDKQREDLLQIYLDRMSELLLEKKLGTSPDEEVRNVARVRTLTTIGQLDTKRQNAVLTFLREANLVDPEPGKSIVALSEAQLGNAALSETNFSSIDLSLANLHGANLSNANLSNASLYGADLSEANLSNADLSEANLSEADLSEANLSEADLSEVNLHGAILSLANLNDADLSSADLSEANLHGANLSLADLSNANLNGADLREASLTRANLAYVNITGKQVEAVHGLTPEQSAQANVIEEPSV
jgi:uncharacterized protein YjbI with pentapeptide repeats